MIIKAFDADRNSFVMYDNVSEIIHFQPAPHYFSEGDKLEEFYNKPDEYADYDVDLTSQAYLLNIAIENFPDGGMYILNTLKFRRSNGKVYRLMLEESCYICNDEGKTIETVRAGGFQEAKKHLVGGE